MADLLYRLMQWFGLVAAVALVTLVLIWAFKTERD